MFESYKRFWSHALNTSRIVSGYDFITVTVFNLIIFVLALVLFILGLSLGFTLIPAFVLFAFFLVSMIPQYTITARFFNCCDKPKKLALLVILPGVGLLALLFYYLICKNDFDPYRNIPVCLYDCPEVYPYYDPDKNEPENDEPVKTEEPVKQEDPRQPADPEVNKPNIGFNPEQNIPVCVYGPPEYFKRKAYELEQQKKQQS